MGLYRSQVRVGNQSSTADFSPEGFSPAETIPWIRLSDFDAHGPFWSVVKAQYAAIAGNFSGNQTDDRERFRGRLLIGEIAIATGFSVANGILSFNPANVQIDKFTYLIAFKLPFEPIKVKVANTYLTQSHPELFSTCLEACNTIRLKYWQDNINGSVQIYKRLTPEGEEEIRDRNNLPQSAINPEPSEHYYNSKYKYTMYAGSMHKKLKQMFFGTSEITEVPLPYYLLGKIEAPFIGDGWLDAGKSFPYNVSANIPQPTSDFKTAVVKKFYKVNSNNQLTPTTDFFFPTRRGEKRNYKHFPVFGPVITNHTNSALIGKVAVTVYEYRRQNVILTPLSQGRTKAYFDNKPLRMDDIGDIYVNRESQPPLLKDVSGANNYDPDIFSGWIYVDQGMRVYYDKNNDVNFVKELRSTPTVLYAEVELAAGLQASELDGHRIYGLSQTNGEVNFSALIPGSNAISNASIVGNSGITLAFGVDISAFEPGGDTFSDIFINQVLSPNCPNWNAMTIGQKTVIKQGFSLHTTVAANHWLRNLVLYNKLDLQLVPNSYYNVLKSQVGTRLNSKSYNGFFDKKYLDQVYADLGIRLKTRLNFVEKFVALTLNYNLPSNTRSSTKAKNLADAINTHSYRGIVSFVRQSSGFSVDDLLLFLDRPEIKDYYRTTHFNTI